MPDIASRPARSTRAPVSHISGVDLESQPLVEGHRGRIRLVDVEHRDGQSTAGQIAQPGHAQRAAQAPAVPARVDAENVDLAERRIAAAGRMDLGPVEAE